MAQENWWVDHHQQAISYVERNALLIFSCASIVETDPLAIAGAIAREITGEYKVYNTGINSVLRPLMIAGRDAMHTLREAQFALSLWTTRHDYYLYSYNQSIGLALNDAPTLIEKSKWVTLNDVGPGKIRLNTAITLLRKYIAAQSSNDLLDLKKYQNDYNLFADDLWGDEVLAAKIAALYIKDYGDSPLYYSALSPPPLRVIESRRKSGRGGNLSISNASEHQLSNLPVHRWAYFNLAAATCVLVYSVLNRFEIGSLPLVRRVIAVPPP
jgi:hypothetical protein